MINLINQDSSFFNITSPDIDIDVLNEDIIAFSYEEEIGRYNSGNIQLIDQNNKYSKILRIGARLNISFGYLKKDGSMNSTLALKENPSQVFGPEARNGIRATVQGPSGSGKSDGVVIFNCNFYGSEYLDAKQTRVHVGLTRGALVRQLLTEIGCTEIKINFSRQNETLTQDTGIIQRETNYRLLLRFAREWRCVFRISYNNRSQMTAIFLSPDKLQSIETPMLMSGAIGGDTILLDYKGKINNVIEYNWKNQAGGSGQGDNVRIVTGADGRPSFIRYVTSGDTVQAYKLNENRIKDKLRSARNFTERTKLVKEWISTNEFEKVKWAFDPVELSTAPQGLGYSMTAKILGDPLLSSPLKVIFTETFPVWFSPKNDKTHVINYYARKVSHTIDRSGYKVDLDIVDAFTMYGGSFI